MRVTSKGSQRWSEKWGANVGSDDVFEITDQLLKLPLYNKSKPTCLIKFKVLKNQMHFELGERKDEALYLNGQRVQSGVVHPQDRMTFMDMVSIEILEVGQEKPNDKTNRGSAIASVPEIEEGDGPTRVATQSDRALISAQREPQATGLGDDATRAVTRSESVGEGKAKFVEEGDGPTITMPTLLGASGQAAQETEKAVEPPQPDSFRFITQNNYDLDPNSAKGNNAEDQDMSTVQTIEGNSVSGSVSGIESQNLIDRLRKMDPAPLFGVAGVALIVLTFYSLFTTTKKAPELTASKPAATTEAIPSTDSSATSTGGISEVAPVSSAPISTPISTSEAAVTSPAVAPLSNLESGIPIEILEAKAKQAGL